MLRLVCANEFSHCTCVSGSLGLAQGKQLGRAGTRRSRRVDSILQLIPIFRHNNEVDAASLWREAKALPAHVRFLQRVQRLLQVGVGVWLTQRDEQLVLCLAGSRQRKRVTVESDTIFVRENAQLRGGAVRGAATRAVPQGRRPRRKLAAAISAHYRTHALGKQALAFAEVGDVEPILHIWLQTFNVKKEPLRGGRSCSSMFCSMLCSIF